jgi:Flp pilus assembly protein TadG
MKKIVRKLFHSKKAQSMVEMAIMMPLLLLMFFGIIEFGFMLGSYMLIHDLARDGVRAGVVGADKVAIENYIKDEDRAFLLDTEKITVETWVNDTMPDNYTNRKVGDSLTVIVNYNYNLITPIISGIIGNSVSLPAKYVMRIEKT